MIHKALHDQTSTHIRIGEQLFPILKYKTGARCVYLGPYTVIEQVKSKATPYARRAAAGETLSWIIPNDPNTKWELIDDLVQVPRVGNGS